MLITCPGLAESSHVRLHVRCHMCVFCMPNVRAPHVPPPPHRQAKVDAMESRDAYLKVHNCLPEEVDDPLLTNYLVGGWLHLQAVTGLHAAGQTVVRVGGRVGGRIGCSGTKH